MWQAKRWHQPSTARRRRQPLKVGQILLAIGRRPEEYAQIFRTMLVGQAVTESTAIYALVVALILAFH